MGMERISRELERTLRIVEKFEGDAENLGAVEEIAKFDCLRALQESGFIVYCDGAPDDHKYSEYNRIERTVKGRAYFGERRRDRMERYGPAFMGIAGTIIGVIVGAWLAASRPFG